MVPGWPPFGPVRARRFFEKGVLKFVLLDLLKDKPTHGYDLIRALEERFHGFYSPSPGSVYPILQKLQDKGFVTSTEDEGKKTYTITKSGLEFLGQRSEIIQHLQKIAERRSRNFDKNEWKEIIDELHRLRQLFGQKMGNLSSEQMLRIKETIKKACCDIETIFQER